MFKNSDQSLALKGEYYQLDKRYNLNRYTTELPICVVAPGRNLLKNLMHLQFLKSMEFQNYSNYRLIITDDASTDGTYDVLKEKIRHFPRLRAKTTLIKNDRNIGALGNKYLTISNHCQKGDIVFDMDADDVLIGRQVMRLMSTLYHSFGKWFIYSNFVWEKTPKIIVKGLSRQIKPDVFTGNSYRLSESWVTSALRTYLRDLYVKIPKEYFQENETTFFSSSSDRFQMYAIVELAGAEHIKFIPDLLYRYN